MKCNKFKLVLDEFVDGELTRDQSDDMFRHVADCPHCKNLYDGRIKLFSIMKASSQAPWSVDVVQDVMKEIAQLEVPEKRTTFNIPLLIAAISSLIFCLGIFFVGVGSILGGKTLSDAVKLFGTFFETPENFKTGLHEITVFMKGWIIAVKAVGSSLSSFLGGFPVIAIPVIILVILAGLVLFLNRGKEGKDFFSSVSR
jgi:hypothetical protein